MIAFVSQTIVQYIHFLISGLVVFDLIWHWIIVQARGDGVVQTEADGAFDRWFEMLFLDLNVGCALSGTSLDGRDW